MTIPTRSLSSLPSGTGLSRFLICLGLANGDIAEARELSRGFPTTPEVSAVFDSFFVKDISAGTIADGQWAAPLATYGINRDFLLLLQSASIVGRLQASMRRVPFRSKTARELESGVGGAWIGESIPKPAKELALDTLTQELFKATSVVLVSRELLKAGDPVAEAAVRAALVAGMARYLDSQFLDPLVAATTAHPAAITNGATEITSTGSSAANVLADLESMIAAIGTPGESLRWIMRPITLYRLAARLATVGLSVTPGSLLGIPVVAGSTAPAPGGSPAQSRIVLVDAAAIAYSSNDWVDLSVSTQGTIIVDEGIGSPAETTVLSLYQSNLVGLRAEVTAAWQRIFDDSVVFLETSV